MNIPRGMLGVRGLGLTQAEAQAILAANPTQQIRRYEGESADRFYAFTGALPGQTAPASIAVPVVTPPQTVVTAPPPNTVVNPPDKAEAYAQLYDAYKANAVDADRMRELQPWWSPPDPEVCLKIQCGAMTQAEAGPELLRNCTFGGFQGVRTCADPLCAPYCGRTAASVARGTAQPLPTAARIGLQFRVGPGRGCGPVYSGPHFSGPYGESLPCGCPGETSFVNEHPVIAVLLVAGAAYGVYRWRQSRAR